NVVESVLDIAEQKNRDEDQTQHTARSKSLRLDIGNELVDAADNLRSRIFGFARRGGNRLYLRHDGVHEVADQFFGGVLPFLLEERRSDADADGQQRN